VEELAGVVPLVDGLTDVDALVALEADQLAARPARQHLGHLALHNRVLSLEEERSAQTHGEVDGGGQAFVGQVAVPRQRVGLLDHGWRTAHLRPPAAAEAVSSRASFTVTA